MESYIYGVIQTDDDQDFGPVGIDGDAVYTILHRDVAAAVSASHPPALNTAAREEIVRYLFAHQSAIETVMQEHTVIPFKFGSAAANSQEVRKLLEREYATLKQALASMQGKVELDVVATWNKESVFKEVSQEEEIVRFKQGLGPQPSQEDRVRLGRMVEAVLEKKKEKLAPEVLSALSECAQDVCLHDTLDASMVINSAFLTPREQVEDFDRRLDELDGRHNGRLNFRRVGPLPPYSFSTAEIKRADFEEIEQARKLLGLGEEATASQVKEAYWKLSSEYHPDKHPGDAEVQKKFEDMSRAYETLRDYCQGESCSFREGDVRDSIRVEIVRVGKEDGSGG